MGKVKRFVKKRKGLIITFVILAIVAIIAFNVISSITSVASALVSSPSISQLSRQNISNVIMASGNTSAVDVRDVVAENTGAQASYKIVQLAIEEGDSVTQGQVIATLDMQDAVDNVDTAKEGVNDAYADLTDASEQAQFDLSVAQRGLTDAQNQYNINKQNHEDNVAALNANITAAQNAYNDEVAVIGATLEDYLKNWALAESFTYSNIDQIIAELETKYNALSVTDKQDQTNPTTKAYTEYSTLAKLSGAVSTATNALNQANTTYEAQERSSSLAIENARDSLVRTQLNDQSIDAAQTQLDNAQTQLESAQESLEDLYIKAPISGVVTQVNFKVGDYLNGALCTVQNLNSFEIVTTVASYDVVKLQEGMQAIITTDSTSDDEISGVIHSISPIAIDTSGNFEVVVRLSEGHANLRAGVPAKITFLLQESSGVFAVPIDAVLEEDGQKYVYVYEERPSAEQLALGEQDGRRRVDVTTGLETDYLIEIQSEELQEGIFILDDPLMLNVPEIQDMFMMTQTVEAGPQGGPPEGGRPQGG